MSPNEHFPGPLWALAITISASFCSIAVAGLFGPEIDLGKLGIGQAIGFAMVGVLATQRIAAPQADRIGLRGVERSFIVLLVMLLPFVILTSELDNVVRDLTPPPSAEAEDPLEVVKLDEPSGYATVQQLIVIVCLAPVMEEWLFRGIILQGLMSTMGRIPGLMLTSTLFALGSMVPGVTPATVLSYFMVSFVNGVVFGIVRIATQSLLAAMLVHAGFNAISLAAFYLTDSFPIEGFNVADSHTPFSLLAPSLLISGVGLLRLVARFEDVPTSIPIPRDDERGTV